MGEFLKVLNYKDAHAQLKHNFAQPGVESISLQTSLNRRLACELKSPEDMPSFSRSTVDGYAVSAEDTFGSSESLPAFLNLTGEVQMGTRPDLKINSGQCCWIPTGGMLPAGTNAAVMVEYTEKLGEDTVLVYRPAAPGENVMHKGEDVQCGQILFKQGWKIRAQDIGLLASLGITDVPVYKAYNIGIISTGDEIVPIDIKPAIGQVRDVNSHAIAAAANVCGANVNLYPIVKDNMTALKDTIAVALAENDFLVMSGGSSVGILDMTLNVLLSFPDSELLFHGIAFKPGKPTMAVRIGKQTVIGLPGHPVSALMVFNILCAPIICFDDQTVLEALLKGNLASQAGRDDFIPVQLDSENGNRIARPLLGKSGLMSILALADGYIHIPYEKQGLEAGDKVRVFLF